MQEGVPGSGVGCVGALFPDDTGQIDACRLGAYLDEIDQFDAAFFRISPVDAVLPGNVIVAVMVPSPCCRWSGMAGMPSPGNPPTTPLTARLSLSAVRSGAWESDAKDCRFGRRPPWQRVRCCRAGRRTATDGPVPRAPARIGRSPNVDPAGSPIDARWD